MWVFFCYGEARNFQEQYSHLFGYGLGSCPFRYLSVPMHPKKISNKGWREVENSSERSSVSRKGSIHFMESV
jgi:hypothetical protein